MTDPKLPRELPVLGSPLKLQTGMSLEMCEITSSVWASQTAKRLSIDSVRLRAPDLTAAQLRDGGWTDVALDGGELGGLNLTGSDVRRMLVRGTRASGLVMAETVIQDVRFEDTKLNLANFRLAKFFRVEFVRCQLTEADFGGANLRDVTFTDCDLTGADFSGTTMANVDVRSCVVLSLHGIGGLRGATLSSSQLITLLPELAEAAGFKVRD